MIGALGPILVYYAIYFGLSVTGVGMWQSGGLGFAVALITIPIFHKLDARGSE